MHGDNLQRIGIKLFAEDGRIGDLPRFVPVFHSWIQRRVLPGHLLIDVHDYSHIHHGPGILLVSHEANISMDQAEGRPGLLYQRKQPVEGALHERIRTIMDFALQTAAILEQEPDFAGSLRFSRSEILLITNDRLNVPNNAATFEALQPAVAAACEAVLGKVTQTRVDANPKERLAISIRTG